MTLSRFFSALIFAILISIFGNYFLIVDRFNPLENQDAPIFLLEIFLNYFLVFAIFYFCSFRKWILIFVTLIFLLLVMIATYSIKEFNIVINPAFIANIFDNISSFNDVVTIWQLVFYPLIFIAAPLILLLKINIQKDKNQRGVFIFIGVIFCIFAMILSSLNHQIRKGVIFAYPPFSTLQSYIKYRSEIYSSLKNKPQLIAIDKIFNTKFNHKAQDLKIILIIGESARALNFSLDGYLRETNPYLKKISYLLNFKDVTPCSNLTIYSVECMLSRLTFQEFSMPPKEESVIKIFEKSGFFTAYFSTQKAVGDDNGLVLLASQAQKFFFNDTIAKKIGGKMVYDEYLLEPLQSELERSGDSFTILHTQGSHFLFHERYPEKFEVFTPACKTKNIAKCTSQELANAYDNSVLYTDFFIDSAINIAKKYNAIVFYVSDHGQFLGEDGIFYHGPASSVTGLYHKVPMFFWMSDSLLQQKFYQQKFINVQRKINSPLSHDNLFYSLLDCSGIDFKERKYLSICNN